MVGFSSIKRPACNRIRHVKFSFLQYEINTNLFRTLFVSNNDNKITTILSIKKKEYKGMFSFYF